MIFSEAMAKLVATGMTGEDAAIMLQAALIHAGTDLVDELLEQSKDMRVSELMATYGHDGGRAVIILRRKEKA